MKQGLGVLFLCVFLLPAVKAPGTILPDACGDDRIKFDVKTVQSKSAPGLPADGKAQIVLIENENQMIGPFMYATVRFGLDGAWAGANKNNSYFTVNVNPGVHHLCASWQSALRALKKSIDVASFTAQPGKVYYFSANVKVIPTGDNNATWDFSLTPLNDDEGKYRVKAWKLASSKPSQ